MSDRLVNAETGELVEFPGAAERQEIAELQEQLALKDETIADLERDLRNKRTQIRTLKGERIKEFGEDPLLPDVTEIVDSWKVECRHPKASLDIPRFDLTKKALGMKSKDELLEAIWGYGQFPYVVDKQRARTGKKSERYDDLELILRGAQKIENGIKLAARAREDGDASPPVDPQPAATPGYLPTPLDRAVAVLKDEFGYDHVWSDYDDEAQKTVAWWSRCPASRGVGTPCRLRERKGHGSSLEIVCAEGCTEDELHQALDQMTRTFDRRRDEAWSAARAVRTA